MSKLIKPEGYKALLDMRHHRDCLHGNIHLTMYH